MRKILIIIAFFIFPHIMNAEEFTPLNITGLIEPALEKSKYGITHVDAVYMIGWSKDGKIAFIKTIFSPVVPGYSYDFAVQDIVTDKILSRASYFWAHGDLIESDSRAVISKDTEPDIDTVFSRIKGKLLPVMRAYNILPLSKNTLRFRNLKEVSAIDSLDFTLKNTPSSDAGNDLENRQIIIDSKTTVTAVRKDAKKTIFSGATPYRYILELKPCGVLLDPYAERVLLVVAVYSWAIEDEKFVQFWFLGCHKMYGFR